MIRSSLRAFTLLELLIVITIIVILVSFAFPAFRGVQERAKVTKDMNNLRQIGIATQLYMNDYDGALFSPATSWMRQLNPKYVSAWGIFQSPFDTRSPSEAGIAAPVSPISYGINGRGIIGMAADKIFNPSVFILFAPAQASGATVSFQGRATDATVTVLGNGATATSIPGGTTTPPPPPQGTHANRTRINALFADLHSETMPWTTFTNNVSSATDTSAGFRWTPYTPFP